MKDLSDNAVASELSVAIKYSGRIDGAVADIAESMNVSRSTVYDYLKGKIKMSLLFLHTAVQVTDGDPQIKRFLEPDGWVLIRKHLSTPDKDSLEAECLDDLPALAEYHNALRTHGTARYAVEAAKKKAHQELEENFIFWCTTKGINP